MDVLLLQLRRAQLAVGRGRRMDDERFHVRNVRQDGEDLQAVDELLGLCLAALDVKGEDRAGAVREVLVVQVHIALIKARVVDLFNLRMLLQVIEHLLRVLYMALHAQGQRFGALQQQEGVERRDRRAGVTQDDRTDIGHEGSRTDGVRKGNAVIARVCVRDLRIFAAGLPVELAAVDDDTAERGAVTADELGRGMHYDVSAVFDRAEQVRRGKGGVHHQRNVVRVRNVRYRLNVDNIGVRVTEGFNKDRLGVVLNRVFKIRHVVRINKGRVHAELREGVRQIVVRAAVDRLGCDDIAAGGRQCLEGIGQCRGTAGGGKRCYAALERGNTLLENVLRGVRQSTVNITGVR